MMLTDEQVERMVKDSNFVGEHHPYAPLMHVDLCSHVMALAAEREELKGRLLLARHKLDLLHNATIVLRNGMGGHRHWDETQRAGAGLVFNRSRRGKRPRGLLRKRGRSNEPLHRRHPLRLPRLRTSPSRHGREGRVPDVRRSNERNAASVFF